MKKHAGRCCLMLGLVLSLSTAAADSNARLSFGGLDLSDDNRLLFQADSGGGQRTIFVSRLTDLALQQITAFPERIELVDKGRILLTHNSFGLTRISVAGDLPRPVPGFPSFSAGTAPVGGRSTPLAPSADGRWVLYVAPSGAAYGDLTLLNTETGVRRIVSQKMELPARDFPARWSPDSRLFVYAKGGRLFYYSPGLAGSDPADPYPVDERYRQIGEGGINAICWGTQGDFFYLRESILYRVRGLELYTRTIYGDFLSIGSVAGSLPLVFDPLFDRFWLGPDARSILLVKGGKNILYYPLNGDGKASGSAADTLLPYAAIPGGAYEINVLWPASGPVTVTASVLGSGAMTWRFGADELAAPSFVSLQPPPASQCALSPDGKRVLFWGAQGLKLWDYVQWRPIETVHNRAVYSCAWLTNDEYIAGDDRRIERISLSGHRRIVCLTGAEEFGFELTGAIPRILALNAGEWFATDGRSPWTQINAPRVRPVSQISGRYRVYLESQTSGPYANIPMMRNVTATSTTALLPAVRLRETRPAAGPPALPGSQPLGLCFDLYNDDAGLCQTLNALDRFGLKATFFLNGDFIRRYPAAAAAIAEAGHETASLFYAPIDLADSRYRVNDEYIAQGLARNEDEFYEATGKELSLLWHPPFYRMSPEISAAANAAGYSTIRRDLDPMDWLNREEIRRLGVTRYSASDAIERIMAAKKPGAVIPIRLGLLPGGRDDYLFLSIDVLLDALIRDGYNVVPVSALFAANR